MHTYRKVLLLLAVGFHSLAFATNVQPPAPPVACQVFLRIVGLDKASPEWPPIFQRVHPLFVQEIAALAATPEGQVERIPQVIDQTALNVLLYDGKVDGFLISPQYRGAAGMAPNYAHEWTHRFDLIHGVWRAHPLWRLLQRIFGFASVTKRIETNAFGREYDFVQKIIGVEERRGEWVDAVIEMSGLPSKSKTLLTKIMREANYDLHNKSATAALAEQFSAEDGAEMQQIVNQMIEAFTVLSMQAEPYLIASGTTREEFIAYYLRLPKYRLSIWFEHGSSVFFKFAMAYFLYCAIDSKSNFCRFRNS